MNPVLFVDNTRERAALVRLATMANKLNEIFAANILVQPGYYLGEVAISNQASQYNFPTQVNQVNAEDFPLTKVPDQNDVFIGIEAELSIDNRTPGSTLVYPQRYVNPFAFTAANTGNATHLQAFFNGTWSYQVGSTVFIQGQTTRRFLLVPNTQQSSANNQSAYDGARLVPQDGYIVISGKSTSKLQVNIIAPAGMAAAGINGTQNVLSFFMQGYTLQNGAGFARFFSGDISVEQYEAMYIEANKGMTDRTKWQPIKTEDSFGNLK